MFKNVKKAPLLPSFFSFFFSIIFFFYTTSPILGMEDNEDKKNSSTTAGIRKKEMEDDEEKDCHHILAIKSQGNRIIIAARILERLEKKLCKDFDDKSNKISIAKSFHTMAAGYTGAFLLLALCIEELKNRKEYNPASKLLPLFKDIIPNLYPNLYIEETPNSPNTFIPLISLPVAAVSGGMFRSAYQTKNFYHGVIALLCGIFAGAIYKYNDLSFKYYKNRDHKNRGSKEENYNNLQRNISELFQETLLSNIRTRLLIPIWNPDYPKPYVFDSCAAKDDSIDNYLCKDIGVATMCNGIFFDPPYIFNQKKEGRTFYSGASAQNQTKRGIIELPDPVGLALKKEKSFSSNHRKTFVLSVDTQSYNEEFSDFTENDNVCILHLSIPPMDRPQDINIYDTQREELTHLRIIADNYWKDEKNDPKIRIILAYLTEFWIKEGLTYKPGEKELHKLRIEAGIYGNGTKINLANLNLKNSDLDFVSQKVNSLNPTATKLDLSGNVLKPGAVKKLSDILENCPAIEEANLDRTEIKDQGIEEICGLSFLFKLKKLSLRECGITEKGLLYLHNLFKANANSPLPEVDLSKNEIPQNSDLKLTCHSKITAT